MQKLAAQDERADVATDKGAFTVTINAKEIDKKGQVRSTTEEVQKVSHAGGDTNIEVVRATKDGKDLTAEEREQQKQQAEKRKHGKKKDNGDKLESPFAKDQQAKYQFWTLGEPVNHRVRIGFAPKMDATNVYRGEALVDTDAGAVLSMKFSPAKLPPHADRVEIAIEYGAPNHLLSKLVVDGEGSFLFIHKRMLVTTGFSDYH
jgi:hypothetical protein